VGLSKGYALVEYATHAAAQDAVDHMDGGQLDGNTLVWVPGRGAAQRLAAACERAAAPAAEVAGGGVPATCWIQPHPRCACLPSPH
jgi:RNA recognition motif-containing protein